jgi:hypothetical protein
LDQKEYIVKPGETNERMENEMRCLKDFDKWVFDNFQNCIDGIQLEELTEADRKRPIVSVYFTAMRTDITCLP